MTGTEEGATVLVSVIIPVYNGQGVIGEQLEALAAQDVAVDWEILVCDNGSTDATRDVVEAWRAKLPPVRIVDASHRRGPSAAMNAGARVSDARYLLFCDADDVVGENWVRAFVDALEHARYVGAYVEYERLKQPGGMSVTWDSNLPFIFTLPVLPQLVATGSGNFGIHRDLYAQVGGFEEGLETCEDADFSWRVQLTSGEPLTICDAIYHIRTRQTLRSIARQARAWGSSYPTLYRRWALVNAAIAGVTSSSASVEPVEESRDRLGARLRSVVQRIARGEFGAVLSNLTWRLSHARGRRFGAVDTSIEQVIPPDNVREIVQRLTSQQWRSAPRTEPTS